jgi:hypothetical protein
MEQGSFFRCWEMSKSLAIQAQFGYYNDWAVQAPEMQGWSLVTAGVEKVKNLV